VSGTNILVDTNIALYLLSGEKAISLLLENQHLFISEISELELLGFPEITKKEIGAIQSFLGDCTIIPLNQEIKLETIKIKQKYKMKLPDAIIAATAIYFNMPLVSADKGFSKVSNLHCILFEK
jgi:predicted nucleic acid-binding protein